MIYIRCLLNVIGSNFIKTISIIVLAVCSAMFLTHRQKGMALIGLSPESKLPKISFVTSLDTNYQGLKNKIIILPGVKKVEHRDSDSLKEKISLLFKSDILQDVISSGPGYSKYTIYFKPNISSKSTHVPSQL